MSSLKKFDIASRYITNKISNAPVLVTPEACRLLRGLMRMTLQSAANLSSVKKNRLEKYESGSTSLSVRDKRWLQSMFENAGAEFFMGQGKFHVAFKEQPVITFGECADELKNLPWGTRSTQARYIRANPETGERLSQRAAARMLGVSPHCISAIENKHNKQFHLADLVALKKLYDEIPEDERLHAILEKEINYYGSTFVGGQLVLG